MPLFFRNPEKVKKVIPAVRREDRIPDPVRQVKTLYMFADRRNKATRESGDAFGEILLSVFMHGSACDGPAPPGLSGKIPANGTASG
jgi:hypothetical protein